MQPNECLSLESIQNVQQNRLVITASLFQMLSRMEHNSQTGQSRTILWTCAECYNRLPLDVTAECIGVFLPQACVAIIPQLLNVFIRTYPLFPPH